MPTLKVAHINQQGQNIIIAPLDGSFDRRSSDEQRNLIAEIQLAASNAGLAGRVVPVWISGGRMKFIALQQWHPFFRSIDMRWVMANLNQTLTW